MSQLSNQDRQSLLAILHPLLAHGKFTIAATEFLSQLIHALGCQRASLGFSVGDHVEICAVSQHYQTLKQQPLMEVVAAMEESLLQNTTLVWPEVPSEFPHIKFSHQELIRKNGLFSALTVPLVQDGKLIGAITLEHTKPAIFDAEQLNFVEQLASHVAPLLHFKYNLDRPLWTRGVAAVRKAVFEDGQKHLLSARNILIAAAGLCVLLLFVVPLSVNTTGQAHLDPLTERVISSPIDGYLKDVHFRPGDQVKAGQIIAELNDDNLRVEQRRLSAEILQQQNALADAMVKADRTQVVVHSANLDQINAQKELVEQQITLTKLVAPFDGLIVKGDLTHLLGTPFKRSDVLFTLSEGKGLRVMVDIGERDIQDLRVGETGTLVLSALPSEHFDIRVARISPVAGVTSDGQNAFEVEATITGNAARLAPGMKGTAKIVTGTYPIGLGWITHTLRALYYFGWSHV